MTGLIDLLLLLLIGATVWVIAASKHLRSMFTAAIVLVLTTIACGIHVVYLYYTLAAVDTILYVILVYEIVLYTILCVLRKAATDYAKEKESDNTSN